MGEIDVRACIELFKDNGYHGAFAIENFLLDYSAPDMERDIALVNELYGK
jgi:sugar phosphate isomerase/epimerase